MVLLNMNMTYTTGMWLCVEWMVYNYIYIYIHNKHINIVNKTHTAIQYIDVYCTWYQTCNNVTYHVLQYH